MQRYVRPIAIILCAGAVAVAGCAKRDEAPTPAPAAAEASPSPQQADGPSIGSGDGAEADTAPVAVPAKRKIIQTAELELEVDSYADARRVIERQLRAAGGYLASAEVGHHDGRASTATLVLRVPADRLATFMDASASIGAVRREKLETEDVTAAYHDLDARLRSAKALEKRLLELVASHTDEVADLLEVERELARVRERIESMEGALRRYDDQVAYSTLRIVLITTERYAGAAPSGLFDRAATVLGASWSALVSLGRALVLAAAGLLPWLPLLLAAAWIARRLWRRIVRLGRRPAPPPPAPPYGAAGPMAEPNPAQQRSS